MFANTIAEKVSRYKELKFFQEKCELLLAWLEGIYNRGDPAFFELALLSMDKQRCLLIDPESVYERDLFYKNLVNALGRISRGAFTPKHVSEKWERHDFIASPVITIEFQNTETHQILVARDSDYANQAFIDAVNCTLDCKGLFYLFAVDDWFIIYLYPEEEQRFEEISGLTISMSEVCSNGDLLCPQSAEMYFCRGMKRYERDEHDLAWGDWRKAHESGMADAYKIASEMANR